MQFRGVNKVNLLTDFFQWGKSSAIVKNESHVTRAKEIFARSSIRDKN